MSPPHRTSGEGPSVEGTDWSLEERVLSPNQRRRFEPPGRERPTFVGRYRILDSLGHGGMGIVYLAQHPITQQQVALKVIIPHSVTPQSIEQFLGEIRLLARVRHPGIAQVYDADTYMADGETRPYFTMEFVEGAKPLTAYVVDALCGHERRIDLALQAAAAVAHAHTLGICHGDLKPRNVLVGLDGRVRIVDFGAALEVSQGPVGQRAWTPGPYAAPELHVPGEPVNLATDVYALGVLVHEMLAGRLPFDQPAPVQPASPLVSTGGKPSERDLQSPSTRLLLDTFPGDVDPGSPSRQPVPLRKLNPRSGWRVEAVLRKALATLPSDRYGSGIEFLRDLEKARRNRTLSIEERTLWSRARDNYLDHRKAVWAVGAVILSLLIGLGGTALKNRETQRERLRAEAEATRAQGLAAQEHRARQRAESAEASATVALEFLRKLLFSVDAYSVRDQRLDLDYVFREAALHLHEMERLDLLASALSYGVLGRVATDWRRFDQAEQWLTRGAELWAMTADRASDPETRRKAGLEHATVLNHLAWAALGDQQDTHGLRERAARAAAAAEQAFDLDLEELGPRHDDTLCSQADWLRMRQLAGENAPTVIMGFVDWLATAAGQSREEFLSSFAAALRESARLSAQGDAAGARDTVSVFLDQVFSRERPRLRARVPLSLARTSRWLDSSGPVLGMVLMPLGVRGRDVDSLSRTLMDVSRSWAQRELPPGHPDQGLVAGFAAGLAGPEDVETR